MAIVISHIRIRCCTFWLGLQGAEMHSLSFWKCSGVVTNRLCHLLLVCMQVTIGYVLSAVNKTIWYNQPITVVAATANVTSPAAINADAPSVTVTLPVFAAPSSALATQVPKAVVGLAVLVASMMML